MRSDAGSHPRLDWLIPFQHISWLIAPDFGFCGLCLSFTATCTRTQTATRVAVELAAARTLVFVVLVVEDAEAVAAVSVVELVVDTLVSCFYPNKLCTASYNNNNYYTKTPTTTSTTNTRRSSSSTSRIITGSMSKKGSGSGIRSGDSMARHEYPGFELMALLVLHETFCAAGTSL